MNSSAFDCPTKSLEQVSTNQVVFVKARRYAGHSRVKPQISARPKGICLPCCGGFPQTSPADAATPVTEDRLSWRNQPQDPFDAPGPGGDGGTPSCANGRVGWFEESFRELEGPELHGGFAQSLSQGEQ